MKRKYFFFALFATVAMSFGCSREYNLEQTIFIYDPEFQDLPIYSEWGYNSFGAYYDREAFISLYDGVPLKIVVTGDSTTFIFSGHKGSFSDEQMKMKFVFFNYNPSDYLDLLELDNTTYDLTQENIMVIVSFKDVDYVASVFEGSIQFKRAQNLYVDEHQVEVILSGLFNFKALVNDEPVSVTDGRFDCGIDNTNFFNY